MSTGVAGNTTHPRRRGRSIFALIAGFIANIVLTLGTDVALHAAGILPVPGQAPLNHLQSALALTYRTLYAVISAYIVARLAPDRPLEHALVGGAIGTLLATVGAVATWNKDLGPHWYALLLIVLALPSGWVGAKLWISGAR